MTRLNVLREIDKLLKVCQSCTVKAEIRKQLKTRSTTYSDSYCNRECPIGAKLQEQGKRLGRKVAG